MSIEAPVFYRKETNKDRRGREAVELRGLNFTSKNRTRPLPNWARFYFGLGAQLASFPRNDSRLVVALSLPTRSYCAAFVSLGFIVNRENLVFDIGKHQEFLRSCPKGTAVWIVSKSKKKFKGALLGERITSEGAYFVVKTDHSTEYNIKVAEASNIVVRVDDEVSLAQTQRGRYLAEEGQLARFFFDSSKTEALTQSRLELVIVGHKKWLKYEMCEEDFYLNEVDQMARLQEVIKVKEFSSGTRPFRSSVFSDRTDFTSLATGTQDVPLTIFDGSQAFLRWRSYWPQSNWMVALDRTERLHNDATSQVNNDYLAREADTGEALSFSGVPEGIQLMTYLST